MSDLTDRIREARASRVWDVAKEVLDRFARYSLREDVIVDIADVIAARVKAGDAQDPQPAQTAQTAGAEHEGAWRRIADRMADVILGSADDTGEAVLADYRKLSAGAARVLATTDADRVRAVVRGAIHASVGGEIGEMGSARIDAATVTAIADRIAAQIPTPPTEAAQLRADRDDPKVQDVVREILVAFLASDGPVTTAEEIDVIADRVAAGLAARAVDRAADDDPDHFIT